MLHSFFLLTMAALSAAHYSPYSGVKRSAKAASNTTFHIAFLRGILLGMAKGFVIWDRQVVDGAACVSQCVCSHGNSRGKKRCGGKGRTKGGRTRERVASMKAWLVQNPGGYVFMQPVIIRFSWCWHTTIVTAERELLSCSVWLRKHFYKHTEMDTEQFLCCSFFQVITQQRQKYCFSP